MTQKNEGLNVFVDDILIGSHSQPSLMELTGKVLDTLLEAGARLRKEKCVFGVDKVSYLGYVISEKGLETDPEKVAAIMRAERPKDKTGLRAFLGIVHYYGRFMKDLSTVCSPLNNLLKADSEFIWSRNCEQVKVLLSSAPILAFFNPNCDLILQCDASPFALGAVLTQVDGQVERPIAYAHRTLTDTERRYSQLDREALSITWSVKKFNKYLWDRAFKIESDHKPLLRILGDKTGLPTVVASRLSRYAFFLSQFNYELGYKKSSSHMNADALSRLRFQNQGQEEFLDNAFYALQLNNFSGLTLEGFVEHTLKDELLCKAISVTETGWGDSCPEQDLMPFFRKRDELSLSNNLLFWGPRLVIPTTLRSKVLEELHLCHPGSTRMKQLARMHCWWPGLDEEIERKVGSCTACLENRISPAKPTVLAWPAADGPWSRIHVDYAPKFMGYALLIVCDAYFKWIEVGVTRTDQMSTERTLDTLNTFFSRFGLPKVIVSDNGTQFTSKVFTDFCAANGIQQQFSAPYHPATNGQAERSVQTVKLALKKIFNDTKVAHVPKALENFLSRYRATPHTTTGRTPAELFLGREVRNRLSIMQEAALPKTATKSNSEQMTNIKIGMKVYTRCFGRGTKKWVAGKVESILGSRHFMIRVGENTVRRHLSQIFPTPHAPTDH